jgi:hypothetical protein
VEDILSLVAIVGLRPLGIRTLPSLVKLEQAKTKPTSFGDLLFQSVFRVGIVVFLSILLVGSTGIDQAKSKSSGE